MAAPQVNAAHLTSKSRDNIHAMRGKVSRSQPLSIFLDEAVVILPLPSHTGPIRRQRRIGDENYPDSACPFERMKEVRLVW